MAVKRRGKRQSKKRPLANAVRSHTGRLRAPHPAAEASRPAAPIKAAPASFPADLVEDKQNDELNNMPPVMLIITVLALLFIGLIAWLVAQMPAK